MARTENRPRRGGEERGMTLSERIDELADKHGGLRAVARVLEIDQAYLWRLRCGKKTEPSEAVLRKLGLRRIVRYERRKT